MLGDATARACRDQAAHLGKKPFALLLLEDSMVGGGLHQGDMRLGIVLIAPEIAHDLNVLEQAARLDLGAPVRYLFRRRRQPTARPGHANSFVCVPDFEKERIDVRRKRVRTDSESERAAGSERLGRL